MRQIADLPLGILAAHPYIHGQRGSTFGRFSSHHTFAQDRSLIMMDWLQATNTDVSKDFFVAHTDAGTAYGQRVVLRARYGVDQRPASNNEPGLQNELARPALTIWLVSHATLKTSCAIGYAFDYLAHEFQRIEQI